MEVPDHLADVDVAVCARYASICGPDRSDAVDATLVELSFVARLISSVCQRGALPAPPAALLILETQVPLSADSGSESGCEIGSADDGDFALSSSSLGGLSLGASLDISLDNSCEWGGGGSSGGTIGTVPGLALGLAGATRPAATTGTTPATAARDHDAHATAILLALSLLIDYRRHSGTAFDGRYCARYPEDCDHLRALRLHLNGPTCPADALAHLHARAATPAVAPSVRRLLRLLVHASFDPTQYGVSRDAATRLEPESWGWRHLADGAYSRVWATTTAGAAAAAAAHGASVAVKLLDVPRSAAGRCVLFDVFTEVSLLERCGGAAGVCKLLDYGVTPQHYWLVFERCALSLKAWRHQTPAPPLRQRLDAFEAVAAIVCELHDDDAGIGIAHLDLKADNVLLRECDGKDSNAICLADFGSGIILAREESTGRLAHFTAADDVHDLNGRGTEAVMSPEMIARFKRRQEAGLVGGTFAADSPPGVHARRSDAWSLGCLAFELVAGDYLFSLERAEGDWVKFFMAITSFPLPPRWTEERLVEADPAARWVHEFLRVVLIRDDAERPSAREILSTFRAMRCAAGVGGEGVRVP